MSFEKSTCSSARRVVLAALGATTLSLFATHATADEAPAQSVVRYADLNLAEQEGVEQLYARLENAARAVCRAHGGRELVRMRIQDACEQHALSEAVAKVDHAAVTALHKADPRVRLAQQSARTEPRT